MRRHAIGIAAVVMLVAGVVPWFWPQPEGYAQFAGAFGRIGLLLVVAWLAYDQIQRMPGWLVLALPVVFVILIINRRLFLFVIPVLLVLAILKPRVWPRRTARSCADGRKASRSEKRA